MIDLEAELGIEGIRILITFVDTAFSIHSNIKIYIRGATTFSIGVFVSDSKIQKLNITNSIDTKIITTSNFLPKIIFMHLFLKA